MLNENDLCSYYAIDNTPGIKAKGRFVAERFAYLDDTATLTKLAQFTSDTTVNITFSIPQMHCSSCIFLLENLHRIEPGIGRSLSNFQRKEVFVSFNPQVISLRKVVELLAFIGYEPYISLRDTAVSRPRYWDKNRIYRIGIAGFCFANIMMLSFPEYFSGGAIEQPGLKQAFTWLIFGLSLPVLFFSASGFFTAAWKGLRQRFLNIDTPIALAILVTFARSYYEIISGKGAGYLDSGSGIVFFMLIGRWFQDRTYEAFSFDRDYRSYFPLGVTLLQEGKEKNIPVTQLKKGDMVCIRNEEMIPADAVLIKGRANIDYSFVSGETLPVSKRAGALLYAGGKQSGEAITVQVVNGVSQSYITQLWNNAIFETRKNQNRSFIHPWSRYFTLALFMVATSAAIYWQLHDARKLWPVVTAVLIVACPCSLLLSATFTFGNMLRVLGRNKLYLKNAAVIESLAKAGSIVFDKTGTITAPDAADITYYGESLSTADIEQIKLIAAQSSHPLSKIIAASLTAAYTEPVLIHGFKEYSGLGSAAVVNGESIRIGTRAFVQAQAGSNTASIKGSQVHVMIGDRYKGYFSIANQYREGTGEVISSLKRKGYDLHVLSGDNDAEEQNLRKLFGKDTPVYFYQSPQDKLDYIKALQQHHKVIMLGDGLNDAGALMQADAGIAVSDSNARFTPACDAIIDGKELGRLDAFLAYARAGKKIILASFILSIAYNIAGLSFAVQGLLSPMIAAILMPASSISIVLLVTLLSAFIARRKGL